MPGGRRVPGTTARWSRWLTRTGPGGTPTSSPRVWRCCRRRCPATDWVSTRHRRPLLRCTRTLQRLARPTGYRSWSGTTNWRGSPTAPSCASTARSRWVRQTGRPPDLLRWRTWTHRFLATPPSPRTCTNGPATLRWPRGCTGTRRALPGTSPNETTSPDRRLGCTRRCGPHRDPRPRSLVGGQRDRAYLSMTSSAGQSPTHMRTAMSDPIAQQLPRRGRGTHLSEYPTADGESPGPASWTEVEKALRAGDATSWLSTRSPAGVHTRPLFAAWTGTSFVFATKSSAAKTAHMDADGRVSLAVDLHTLHLVVEGTVERLTSEAELTRASTALLKVYGWPTTVVGGRSEEHTSELQ